MLRRTELKKAASLFLAISSTTLVDNNGLAIAVETTTANQHDSKPLLALLDKTEIKPGTWVHANKAYYSQEHRRILKALSIKSKMTFR